MSRKRILWVLVLGIGLAWIFTRMWHHQPRTAGALTEPGTRQDGSIEADFTFAQTQFAPRPVVSVTLGSIRDNTLYEHITGTLSNGAGDYFYVGNSAAGVIRRGVIAFDIAGEVPPASTILTVTLKLNMSRTTSGAQPVTLHRLLADWGEGSSDPPGEREGGGTAATTGDATWLHTFYDTVLWTTAGGDFSPTASATTTVDGTGKYVWGTTTGMVGDVQGWLDAPATNWGWLLQGNKSGFRTSKRFNTKEHYEAQTRPALTIEYRAPYTLYLPCVLND